MKILSVPARVRRTGLETRLLIPERARSLRRESDRSLLRLLGQARRFHNLIVSGEVATITALAKRVGVTTSYVTRVFRLSFLAPQITKAILDGRLPPVIPNVAKLPEAKRLPAARFPRIRSFVSVPVRLSDGELYGTFCAAGFAADRDLCARDQALMEVLASAAATVIEPGVRDRRRSDEICSRLAPVVDGGGPTVLLQAIVSLDDGRRVGAEALSRFTSATFAVGARLEADGRMTIAAPFGLEDIFALRLRPNPIRQTAGFRRTAEAAKARWPELTILDA